MLDVATVQKLLERLEVKKFVRRDDSTIAHRFTAAVKRDEMTRQEVRSIFQRLASQALKPVLAHFIEEAELSDEEIRDLKQQLDAKRKRRAT